MFFFISSPTLSLTTLLSSSILPPSPRTLGSRSLFGFPPRTPNVDLYFRRLPATTLFPPWGGGQIRMTCAPPQGHLFVCIVSCRILGRGAHPCLWLFFLVSPPRTYLLSVLSCTPPPYSPGNPPPLKTSGHTPLFLRATTIPSSHFGLPPFFAGGPPICSKTTPGESLCRPSPSEFFFFHERTTLFFFPLGTGADFYISFTFSRFFPLSMGFFNPGDLPPPSPVLLGPWCRQFSPPPTFF